MAGRLGVSGARAAPATGLLRLPGEEPSTLDPALVRDTTASAYIVELFAGLTRIGPDLTPQPALAESWTVSADGLLYHFRLHAGLRFQDGRPLTAQDVKWSWERALNPRTGSLSAQVFLGDVVGADDVLAYRTRSLSGVRVLDPLNVAVQLTQPASFFPAKLSNGPALVVDRTNVSQGPTWFRRPNGSGPYRLETWDPDARIVLRRSETYEVTGPGPERVQFAQLEGGEGLLRFEQNELDLVGVSGTNVDRFSDPREPLSTRMRRTSDLSVQYLGFNTRVPPFDDRHVRRALALAIDRPRINRVTLRGHQVEARGIIPPGLPGHRPDFPGLTFDPESARAELTQSRYGSAEALPEIVLVAPGSGLLEGPVVRAIVQPWRTILGISVSVQQLDFNEFVRALDARDRRMQMFSLGWAADFPDPFDFLDVLFGSDRPDNYAGLHDSLVDSLLQQARRASNESVRLGLYGLVETRVVEEAVVAPLYFSVSHELVQPWIAGYPGRPIVREWLTEVSTSRA